MNDSVRTALCDLIRLHGILLAEDPKRLRALLSDTSPGCKRENNLLGIAAEQGVPREIQSASRGMPWEALAGRLARRLQDEFAIDPEAACWLVETWGIALGRISSEQAALRTVGPPQQPHTSTEPIAAVGAVDAAPRSATQPIAGKHRRRWLVLGGAVLLLVGGGLSLLLLPRGAESTKWTIPAGPNGLDLPSFVGVEKPALSLLAIAPTSNVLAFADGKQIQLRYPPDGKRMRSLNGASWKSITSVAFSPDGRRIAIGVSEGNGLPHIDLWDVVSGATLGKTIVASRGLSVSAPGEAPRPRQEPEIRHLVFEPDGKRIVFAFLVDDEPRTCEVRVWEPSSSTRNQQPGGATETLFEFRRSGTVANVLLDVVSDGTNIRVAVMHRDLKPETKQELPDLWIREANSSSSWQTSALDYLFEKKRMREPRNLVLSRDGQRLAGQLDPMWVTLWNTATGETTQSFSDSLATADCTVDRLFFSPDGHWLVGTASQLTVGRVPRLKIWANGGSGRVAFATEALRGDDVLSGKVSMPSGIAETTFSSDGKILAAIVRDPDFKVRLWDVPSLKLEEAARRDDKKSTDKQIE